MFSKDKIYLRGRGIHCLGKRSYLLILAVFRCLLKAKTDRATIVTAMTAIITIKVSNGKVIEFEFVSGAIGVEVGVEGVVGDEVVGFGVSEVEASPIVIV